MIDGVVVVEAYFGELVPQVDEVVPSAAGWHRAVRPRRFDDRQRLPLRLAFDETRASADASDVVVEGSKRRAAEAAHRGRLHWLRRRSRSCPRRSAREGEIAGQRQHRGCISAFIVVVRSPASGKALTAGRSRRFNSRAVMLSASANAHKAAQAGAPSPSKVNRMATIADFLTGADQVSHAVWIGTVSMSTCGQLRKAYARLHIAVNSSSRTRSRSRHLVGSDTLRRSPADPAERATGPSGSSFGKAAQAVRPRADTSARSRRAARLHQLTTQPSQDRAHAESVISSIRCTDRCFGPKLSAKIDECAASSRIARDQTSWHVGAVLPQPGRQRGRARRPLQATSGSFSVSLREGERWRDRHPACSRPD